MRYIDPDGRADAATFYEFAREWISLAPDIAIQDSPAPGPYDVIACGMVVIAGGALLIGGIVDLYNYLSQKTQSNSKVNENSNASTESPSPLPPDPDDEENLEYESNPKHHQNARGNASQEPKNAKEMFEKSVKDPTKDGTRWYKDKNGNFHRFKEHHNGKYHWNGSTNTGTRLENVPIEIRRNLPKGEF